MKKKKKRKEKEAEVVVTHLQSRTWNDHQIYGVEKTVSFNKLSLTFVFPSQFDGFDIYSDYLNDERKWRN